MQRSRLIFVLLAVVATALVMPSVASAHANYKSSVPAKGEVVTASPSQVEIIFTQDMQKVAGSYDIQVERDRGSSVNAGPAVIDESNRARMTVPLKPNLTPGRYVVHWKNVSDEDGDPNEGAFSFYVNAQPNAVDLANDKQLESVGAEVETPGATTTSTAATATTATTAASGTPAGIAPLPTPTSSVTPSSGGGTNKAVYIVIGALAVAVVGAVGAWWVFARRPA
jgi:methionine-rich copper-binding protein CopC